MNELLRLEITSQLFSLAEPHKSRDDAELNALLSKAENLKREAEERAKQARIVALVAKIKDSTEEDRASLLQDLVSLDPRTGIP